MYTALEQKLPFLLNGVKGNLCPWVLYNHPMTTTYEIRVCDSCGLRYPLLQGHPHGTRCPVCMGSTRHLLSRKLILEPTRDLNPPSPDERQGFSVLLDNIRSAWNVGSILRSADGFGFVHAYLCGISPTPEVEAVQKRPSARRMPSRGPITRMPSNWSGVSRRRGLGSWRWRMNRRQFHSRNMTTEITEAGRAC